MCLLKSIYFILSFLNIAPEKIKNTDLNQSRIITFISGKKFFVFSNYCWATVRDKSLALTLMGMELLITIMLMFFPLMGLSQKNHKTLLCVVEWTDAAALQTVMIKKNKNVE